MAIGITCFLIGLMGIQTVIADEIPEVLWEKTFGTSDEEFCKFVQQTTDGGFILVGSTRTDFTDDYDIFLLKTDSNGNQEWFKIFGVDNEDEEGFCVRQTSDLGFIIAGYSTNFEADTAIWLIKTNSVGEEIWNKTHTYIDYSIINDTVYESEFNDQKAYFIQHTTDDGFVIVGFTSSYYPLSNKPDVWLIKTDDDGDIEWSHTFGGNEIDYGRAVQQTLDGGFIIIGEKERNDDYDMFLIKVNAEGVEEWNNTYGGIKRDVGRSVQQSLNGGYICAGTTASFGAGGADAWMIYTDSQGNELWNHTFGGENPDGANAINQINNDEFVTVGTYESPETDEIDVWFFKTDSNGSIIFDEKMGGMRNDYGNSLVVIDDEEYIIAGTTESEQYGIEDIILIKIGPEISGNNTPGFELIFSIAAIAMILFWRRKKN